jgi:hypothetical protein
MILTAASFGLEEILIMLVIYQSDFQRDYAFQRRCIVESNSRIAALQRDNARRS